MKENIAFVQKMLKKQKLSILYMLLPLCKFVRFAANQADRRLICKSDEFVDRLQHI